MSVILKVTVKDLENGFDFGQEIYGDDEVTCDEVRAITEISALIDVLLDAREAHLDSVSIADIEKRSLEKLEEIFLTLCGTSPN